VEVYVHSLRKKLGADFIRNVRGMGYVIAREAQDPAPGAGSAANTDQPKAERRTDGASAGDRD
jgi:hypothetical protein